jgi:hypothetical protein
MTLAPPRVGSMTVGCCPVALLMSCYGKREEQAAADAGGGRADAGAGREPARPEDFDPDADPLGGRDDADPLSPDAAAGLDLPRTPARACGVCGVRIDWSTLYDRGLTDANLWEEDTMPNCYKVTAEIAATTNPYMIGAGALLFVGLAVAKMRSLALRLNAR